MSRIRRIAPRLSRGGLIGNTEGPEAYLRELDTLPSQFCRATGGTETVISQGGKYYRVHTFTDTDPREHTNPDPDADIWYTKTVLYSR